MRLAVVVQRYGVQLSGGAELHARYVAEHLARHAQVDVLTTCATDYITWRNELPEGIEEVNGVVVRRFPVDRERDPDEFGRRSQQVFEKTHSLAAELAWLESEGPASSALLGYLDHHATQYDYFIFFSYRYHHAYHGIRRVASKAVLVPTAERDPALGLALFGPIFRAARAVMYNSFEERALIHGVAGNDAVRGPVVGIGSDVPAHPQPKRFRQRTGLTRSFAVYVGRIDENKGCAELFDFFQRYARTNSKLDLVLIGAPVMAIPSHPRIRHLGFLPDDDKFDAMAASSLLIMPSYFESLSMVTLESWALGVPVLVNGVCDVLCGQAIRANAGLYYTGYEEFAESLGLLATDHKLRRALGLNGRRFFSQHYAWPVIEQKYLDTLAQLEAEDRVPAAHRIEPLPGWIMRHRRQVPGARSIIDALPRGPVTSECHSRAAQPPRTDALPSRRRGSR